MPLPCRGSVRSAARGAALAVLAASSFACGGGGGGGGDGGGGGAPTAQDLASVSPSGPIAARFSAPGAFAADYLRATNFRSLVVEIDYPVGKPPSAAAVALLQDRLSERCDKPDGVSIEVDDAIPAAEFPSVVSVSDLIEIEQAHRNRFSDLATQTAVFYILYTSGHSDADDEDGFVLGLAYAGSSIGFFIDQADPGPLPIVTQQEIEGAGLVHEGGHLLGLVDNGVPMTTPHRDVQHGAHCDDATCVMFWTISIDPLSNITDPSFAQFDAACTADMESFGGAAFPLVLQARRAGAASERIVVGRCGGRHAHAP